MNPPQDAKASTAQQAFCRTRAREGEEDPEKRRRVARTESTPPCLAISTPVLAATRTQTAHTKNEETQRDDPANERGGGG